MSSSADLTKLLASLPGPVLLDLSRVEFLDCSGVRCLLAELHRREAAGSRLRIIATSPAVDRLLSLAGLEFMVAPMLRSVG